MRKLEELKKLAQENDIRLKKRLFIEDRESGQTRFFDVEKSRAQLVQELRDKGLIP